jgi:hypothetical protein
MSPASEEINGKFVKKEGSGADENIWIGEKRVYIM